MFNQSLSNYTAVPEFLAGMFVDIRERGLDLEGIFRVPGGKSKIDEMKATINTRKIPDYSSYDIYSVSSLFKLFFRELSEPVCTSSFYDMILAAQGINVESSRLKMIKKVLGFLPPTNLIVLRELCSLLKDIDEMSGENKMDAHNLALVFAPTLLRSEKDSLEIMTQDSGLTNALIVSFIKNFDVFFN